MKKKVWMTIVVFGIAVLVAGCGGGGGGDSAAPGVDLTIGATAVHPDSEPRSRATTLSAPLDAGATVTVYDYRTGQGIATGKTNASGYCTLEVTPGLTIAVVIVGKRDGKDYRLSTVVPVVPSGDSEFIADPATSIAAEAIAQKHYAKGNVLDQATFDAVFEEAEAFAEANPDADYSYSSGTIINNAQFGAAGSIDSEELADVIASVPSTIDNNMVAAKNAVQRMKEAGTPLRAMYGQELTDAHSILSESVMEKYGALGERLSKLLLPVLLGDMCDDSQELELFDLEIGKAYLVTNNYDGWLQIAEYPAGDVAGQITIKYNTASGETPAGTYTVKAKQSGSNWQLTQTFSGDSLQKYEAIMPIELESANPSVVASVSLKDKVFTTPLTFNGTISAVGADFEHYTKVVFDGSLSDSIISAEGKFQVEFPASLPSGADPDDSIYSFPKSFSMSNASISLTRGGNTVSLTGSISASTSVIMEDGYPEVMPKQVNISGTYGNNNSGLNFEGSIVGSWDNPGDLDVNEVKGTVRVQGQITRSGYQAHSIDLTVTLDEGAATSQIDLRQGAFTLTGTASGTITEQGLTDGVLVLTTDSGVQFRLTTNNSGDFSGGTVKVGSEKVANIVLEGSLLKINFTDSTFEAFPL